MPARLFRPEFKHRQGSVGLPSAPLGPGEIREYLQKNLTVNLNSDANYNGQPAD